MEEITIESVAKYLGNYFDKKVIVNPGDLLKGGTLRRCPDTAKLKQLGFQPKINFQQGINDITRWYIQNADKRPQEKLVTTS